MSLRWNGDLDRTEDLIDQFEITSSADAVSDDR